MGRLLPLLMAVCVVACTPTVTQSQPNPAPPVTATVAAPVTTVATSADYTVTDCATPPVTFALLCDVFGLIQDNHVDAPLDPASLAAGAAVGAEGYRPEEGGEEAEDFQCAIPHPAFESTCEIIASRSVTGPTFSLKGIEGTIEAAVASMITLSLDPFTYYIPPELSGALTEDGIVSAIGLLLTVTDQVGSVCTIVEGNCRLEVVLSVEDGPAHQAGLEPGDVITSIDAEPVSGLSLVGVASLLDGQAGTSVTLTILDNSGATEVVVVARQELTFPALEVEIPRPGVGYIRIPDFEADIPQFVHTALQSLSEEGVNDLVVDLRDNPGGYVDVATLVASEFLADGLVFRSEGPDGNLEYPIQPGGLATDGVEVTVVVNGGSASAAEILAGVLQERGRATIVGSPTFGKNTVQIAFPLRNDGQLRVTIARWTTPDGQSVAIDGVTPDIVVDVPTGASPADIVDLALGGQ